MIELSFFKKKKLKHVSELVGMNVVCRIRFLWIRRTVFGIHTDIVNTNLIVCRYGVGFGVSEIR
jgi:hypothetical protein